MLFESGRENTHRIEKFVNIINFDDVNNGSNEIMNFKKNTN